MKKTLPFALLAMLLGPAAAEVDCIKLAASLKSAASARGADLLQLVEKEVAANPSCACEIVKAAIEGAEADASQVAAIVETASGAAPDQMRAISQCALAVAPDALTEVQAVVARLFPNQGEVSYDSAKMPSPKTPIEVKPAWNPLDFPGTGYGQVPFPGRSLPGGPGPEIGGPGFAPEPGGPGGFPVIPPTVIPPGTVPPIVVPPVEPPVATETDPVESPVNNGSSQVENLSPTVFVD